MSAGLSCWSFHSVKGGVGKSTLATLAAIQLALDNPNEEVWLIDMDLTGTSLADVLPLCAPRCELAPDGTLDLERPRTGFLSPDETKAGIQKRDEDDKARPVGVPFLNDYLVFATEDWDAERDMDIHAIAWCPVGESAPNNLRVLPSSALPRDLDCILPVIFDEEHAAFLENRLEFLLAAMVTPERQVHVVFDVPPTIPGLSRAVLSLALRLGRGGEKMPLSLDGGFPEPLESTPIAWRAVMIATPDVQDIRALARWLYLIQQDEEVIFRVLINRASSDLSEGERSELLKELTVGDQLVSPLLDRAAWISASPEYELFRRSEFPRLPNGIADLLDKLR